MTDPRLQAGARGCSGGLANKAYFRGTHRCLDPEQTLAAIGPLFREYGIERLADVTGLDTLGVPVVTAVRPLGAMLAVSQGKGVTYAAAAVSAAMEAIEHWHSESGVPPAACRAPAGSLDLPYEVSGLTGLPGSIVTPYTVLDWIPARTLSGRDALVPRDLVQMGPRGSGEWSCLAQHASTNGLAAGNTLAEATVHALLELIERDAVAAVAATAPARVDLATAPDYCAAMAEQIREGGGSLRVTAVPSRFGVPCFMAALRTEDALWTAGGAGAHPDPAVALSRAVTEACQTRLTIIAGSRDDLPAALYRGLAAAAPSPPDRNLQPWADVTAGLGWEARTAEGDRDEAARRVTEVTGCEPLVVDLAERAELAVVKVLAPRLRFAPAHPAPGTAA